MSISPFALLVLAAFLLGACGSTPKSDSGIAAKQTSEASDTKRPVVGVSSKAVPEPEPELLAWEAKGVRTAYSRAGTYLIKWLPVGGEVPKNKHFEVDLWLFKNGEQLEPFGGAVVATRGWMPEHGHGMVRQPRSVNMDEGHYRISGMLLHMGGYWQIFFDVVVDGQAESTQFDLTL